MFEEIRYYMWKGSINWMLLERNFLAYGYNWNSLNLTVLTYYDIREMKMSFISILLTKSLIRITFFLNESLKYFITKLKGVFCLKKIHYMKCVN